jgi:hypothetical protein
MAAKKTTKKGKRYSAQEKAEILAFIDSQGRGGQTAAAKKFGVSPLTLSSWRKSAGGEAAPVAKGLDLEIATAKFLNKMGFTYELFKSLSSGNIDRKVSKSLEALNLFGGGEFTVSRIGKGGEPIIEVPLSKVLELTKTKA